MTQTPTPEDPRQDRDEQTVKLLKHLFHKHFLQAENIQPDSAGGVLPAYFCAWIDRNMPLMDGVEVCEQLEIDPDIWHFVVEVLSSGLAPERFMPVWWAVVLAERDDPRHTLLRCHLTMLLTYTDGTIYPGQAVITREMLDEEGPGFNDGLLANLVQKHARHFVESVAEDGIDGLHDRGKNYRGGTPEDPFEVFMGLLLQHLIPKLKPEYQQPVTDYMRLCQGLIRPVLPPEIKSALEMKRRAANDHNKVSGGWDVG